MSNLGAGHLARVPPGGKPVSAPGRRRTAGQRATGCRCEGPHRQGESGVLDRLLLHGQDAMDLRYREDAEPSYRHRLTLVQSVGVGAWFTAPPARDGHATEPTSFCVGRHVLGSATLAAGAPCEGLSDSGSSSVAQERRGGACCPSHAEPRRARVLLLLALFPHLGDAAKWSLRKGRQARLAACCSAARWCAVGRNVGGWVCRWLRPTQHRQFCAQSCVHWVAH